MTAENSSFDPAASRHGAVEETLRKVLSDVLSIEYDQVLHFDAETGLFGHLPELDSMAVATLLTELEDRLDIVIDDEDLEAEMLETFGALLTFAEAKVKAA